MCGSLEYSFMILEPTMIELNTFTSIGKFTFTVVAVLPIGSEGLEPLRYNILERTNRLYVDF